ncbi:MAG TPA: serine/threonine-protein kinase [Polyangiaceae bacterium]|nr:serine/threonine-protein kinase [Polyangiaceae bacterium]
MRKCPLCNLRYPNVSTLCFVDGSPLIPLEDPRVKSTLAGRYVIEDVVGEGGMATVYRARHKLTDRPCAVKVMNPMMARDQVVRERFRREAKAAQILAHPNIIEIFDQGDTEDDTSYLAMELLEGEDLGYLISRGALPVERALPIMVQMARALARAHDFGVLHRDLKPENIFICVGPQGEDLVKLLDFGIARSLQDSRLTGTGEVFGTPQYMAPERITSIDTGPSADLYALGILYFEMMTGRLPFDAPDIPSFLFKHLQEQPPKLRTLVPEAPEALEELVDRMLAKDPASRPVDAHRVRLDLEEIGRALGIALPFEPAPATQHLPSMLPPVPVDRWQRRAEVFKQMLHRAFGAAPPAPLARALDELRRHLRELTALRAEEATERRKLQTIEAKEREGRLRFGAAMDSLGHDASTARAEARVARSALAPLRDEALRCAEAARGAHRDILFWEGRSGFQEPYPQLAAAYHAAGEAVERWAEACERERAARGALQEREQAVSDLEFQVHELRQALEKFEASVGAERSAQEALGLELARRIEAHESELTAIAGRIAEPLRGRPGLEGLFQELETAA